MLYITRLFDSGLAVSTITSRLSAISFIHKMFRKPDPVNSYFVNRFLYSLRKKRPQQDLRLPLTPQLLNAILGCAYKLGFTYYDLTMFRAMLALSFAAFLRPGEVTGSSNNLLFQNISFLYGTLIIQFTHYKSSAGRPFTLYLNPTRTQFCPVKLLNTYLQLRGDYVGPLFCRLNGMPVPYSQFKSMFKLALAYLGVSGRMSLHSIRIGATTHAAASGYTEAEIQRWGRWRSNAYRNYIRLPIFYV